MRGRAGAAHAYTAPCDAAPPAPPTPSHVVVAADEPFRMSRLTLRFLDRGTERAFAAAFAQDSLRQVRTFALAPFAVWALLMVAFYAVI
ncbi:MAG: hypothetical protein AVDCRST_MAG77-2029 [uncultured Chloroflexi bacterium]|uniref:Uncharacterized protein n=1 Tax=uncultured Chloroflexota bacterium TaxID=166587 RepID=A0A6J4IGV2_9CHLR|nr:MAG: hypothetical protein AVDCRST_MAG77-2029 [uncultured Chloroflexota bacterium]